VTTKTNKKKLATTTTTTKGNVPGSQGLTAQQRAALIKAGGMVFSSAELKKLRKDCKGDPVAVATGEVVDDAVDLVFASVLPMTWIRIYSSFSAKVATPLGRGGFTHAFHRYVEETPTRIVVRLDDGTDVLFPKLAAGEEAFHRASRRTLRKVASDRYKVYDHDARLTSDYEPVTGGGERAMLRAVQDAWGNRQELRYEAGALSRVIDPSGRELRVINDSKGRVLAVEAWARGEAQQSVAYAYTDEGELASATDALGYAESYLYDGHHRMIQKTRSNGFRIHYEYSPTGGHCVRTWGDGGLYTVELVFDADQKTTTTHGNPEPMLFTWNDRGDVVRRETFDGAFVDEVVYDKDAYVVENRDASGRVVRVEYDERGNRTKHIDPTGVVTAWEYDGDLPIRELRDGLVMSELRWDGRGALLEVREASGAALFFEHDGQGRVVRVSSKNGLVARYVYDDEHNLVEEHDELGVSRFGYDALGFPAWETDAAGRTTFHAYDALKRPTVTTLPDGRREILRYGPLALPIEQEAPDGGVTRLEYIGTGKVSRIVRPDGQAWSFQYDKNERLIAIENPKAEVYELRWDARGLLIEERTFDGRRIRYQQSKLGAIARIELPDGSYQVYERDLLGRLIALRTPDAAIFYDRDRYGRVVEATAKDALRKVTTAFEYDERGFVSAVTQDGRTIRYEVNPYGFVAARMMPSGLTTRYYWSAADALTAVDHGGHKILFQHSAAGQEVRRYIYDAGVDVVSRYNEMSRLAEQAVFARGAGGAIVKTLSQRRFTYGPMGRLDALTESRFGAAQYAYDSLGRPVEESRRGRRRHFEYDVVGSLIGVFEGDAAGPPWREAQGGVLIRTPDAELEYDKLRQRRAKVRCVNHRPTGDRTEYTWDAMGQLRQIALPGGEMLRFFYDAFGRRVRKEIYPPEPPLSPGGLPAPPPPPRVI
jgi:YD repeat-containing protein